MIASPIPAAPITARQRTMLRKRLANIEATARARGVTLDAWDKYTEEDAGRTHFELGAWLWWAAHHGVVNSGCVETRAHVVHMILASGKSDIGYEFYTVFEFGERDFDSFFEYGDGLDVVMAVRRLVFESGNPTAITALREAGWDAPKYQEAEKTHVQAFALV